MFWVALLGVLVTMALGLVRAALGPTVYDRILALNMLGTKTVLVIALSGFLQGRPEWLDLALIYALINYLGVLAVLRFVKYGSFASDEGVKR